MSDNNELSTRYNPSEVESQIYDYWNENNYFEAEDKSTKIPFSIILPPPNVTGFLHLGHALDHTIQDIFIRWKRMMGYNTLWLPGTDHAGIATQSVVERELKKEGVSRKDLGRDKFVDKVWDWKHQYGNRIVNQMKRLGDSCDWDRLRFTLDDGVSKAVRKVFVDLYKSNLIYKGEKLVNWDTQLETAVSDLEVVHEERKGSLWHIRYPIDGTNEHLIVATTRPETLLGDVAVAVHPEDERYKSFIGKSVLLPLTNRKIPIIADEYVEKDFGSGVVKITPAHDFNDFEVGQRHGLTPINILLPNGKLNENAGKYKDLSVQESRKQVLNDLKTQELLEKEEPYKITAPLSERSGTVVEPFLSQQWFVSINELAEPAKRVVESGTIVFSPESWTKTYLHWMNNIQDWCISRQLWWGHRIPAWNCTSCNHITVSEEDPTECEKCGSGDIDQEEDVLDTWFSSALWPFSTMDWPNDTETQKTFYPTDLMVTGHDIIFFWVARMIMMGLHFKKDVPFRHVYIHGLIRDSQGRKMSKSLGNSLDPLELIEKYGADSLRFTLASQIAAGRDIKFSEQRLEGYRNFMNKVWNAARFSLNVLEDFQPPKGEISNPPKSHLSPPDEWITFKLEIVEAQVKSALESYRISDAASLLYEFTWHDFCDWYLELIKPVVYGEDSNEKTATQLVLAVTLNRILKLLHPFIPFITETIYQKLPIKEKALIIDQYPTPDTDKSWLTIGDEDSFNEIEIIKSVIAAIRNIRGENSIPPKELIKVHLQPNNGKTQKILGNNRDYICKLSNLGEMLIGEAESLNRCAVSRVQKDDSRIDVVIPLEGLVDFEKEIHRLNKEIEKSKKEMTSIERKLSNKNFVENAPQDIVEKDRSRLEELRSAIETLSDTVRRLQ